MQGRFIGHKVESDDYVTWNWSDPCDSPCAPGPVPSAPFVDDIADDGGQDANKVLTVENQLSIY